MSFSRMMIVFWIVSLPSLVSAEGQNRIVTIEQNVRANMEPDRAVLVIASESELLEVVPAVVLPSTAKDEHHVIGRLHIPEEIESISSTAVVFSRSGEVVSSFREIPSISSEPAILLDKISLESRVRELKSDLAKWDSRVRSQNAELERLQSDADVIANVNKIVSVEDELQETQSELQRLKLAQQSAERQVEALREQPVPSDYRRREADIVEQLNELSTALKTAEAGAVQRVAAASSDMQAKLALIESTKGKQLNVLQAELIKLRKERDHMERDLGGR